MSMINNSFECFQRGQLLLKSGKKSEARLMFLRSVRQWQKLAAETEDREAQKVWLQRAARVKDLADQLISEEELSRTQTGNIIEKQLTNSDKSVSDKQEEKSPWEINIKSKVRFSDIAGMDEVKNLIQRRVILPNKNRQLAELYHRQSGTGFLMYGLPGTGKTMMARAIAGELGFTFFKVQSSSVMSKWVGTSEQNFKDLFEAARAKAPAVLFFDEAEAFMAAREEGQSDVMGRVISELLAQIDGVDCGIENLVLAAATNCPWKIDPALKRPGRFGEQIYIPLPDLKAREFILRQKLSKIPGMNNYDFEKLAERTDLFSGADINGLADRIIDPVFERANSSGQVENVLDSDIENAVGRSKPSATPAQIERMNQYRLTCE